MTAFNFRNYSTLKKYNIHHLIDSESFKRWVFGCANRDDKNYWDQWVRQSDYNRLLAKLAQEKLIGISIKPGSRPDKDESWSRFANKYGLDKSTRRSMSADRNSDKYRRSFNKYVMYAAALTLFSVLIVSVFNLSSDFRSDVITTSSIILKEFQTDFGEIKEISIDEGSDVVLNANSKINYSIDEDYPGQVTVMLEGEAYFSVDSSNPESRLFVVRTTAGVVEVNGTRFVISTTVEKSDVVLEQGAVIVRNTAGKSAQLKSGEIAKMSVDSESIFVASINTDVYTSWMKKKLFFDHTPLKEVFSRLERTFGVEIEVEDSSVYERALTGSVVSHDIESIMTSLSVILGMNFYKSGKMICIGEVDDCNFKK